MFKKVINVIFSNIKLFEIFRDFLHNGFVKEKKILLKELNPKKKTLDFGCGIGQYSALFDKKNYLGVDIKNDNINFAKKKFGRNFHLIKNINELKDGKFEQIFCTMTFHHINNNKLKKIFSELYKILNKNGKFLIIDHVNIKSQPRFIGKFMLKFDRGNYTRNIEELKKLFDKFFKIENQYFYRAGPYKDYVLILRKR